MIVRKCNMCGKELDIYDIQERISYHERMGYGSEFDLCRIDLDLCCKCFDQTMNEYILPRCAINPVSEEGD